MAFIPQYSANASGHATLSNRNQRGNISLGRARNMYNTAGRVAKALGGNVSDVRHGGVKMGQGSNRSITSSPTYKIGVSST